MKIVGLIAEYNPFHNGHQYHIQKAKEVSGADHAIVIMSGDYVQRGVPAIMPKRLRAEMALKCGASSVFELPVCYATASAETFALGAVSFLNQLGVVDALCFGSECNDLESLKIIADILTNEPETYRRELQTGLKNGLNYPAARQNALAFYLSENNLFPLNKNNISDLLNDPNNILGIEYLKALKKTNSTIKPFTIHRQGAHYHDQELKPSFSSASAIRTLLAYSSSEFCMTDYGNSFENTTFGNILNELEDQVPDDCLALLKDYHRVKYPIYQNDFSLLLKYKLLNKTPDSLIRYMDVSEELANRIYRQLNNYFNYKQFCELLKTKEMTQTRINRALLHIMLGIKTQDVKIYQENKIHFYAHLLGYRRDCKKIISYIAKSSALPLLTSLYRTEMVSETGLRMLNTDILASNLYTSVITDKYKTAFENEYNQPVFKI